MHKLRASRTERELVAGLAIIALIFVTQALVGSFLDRGAEARARQLYENSLASIEQVTRIVRDIERERKDVDDHVLATSDDGMATAESDLAKVTTDLREARQAYTPFAEQPQEAALWKDAQEALDRFERAVQTALELSRKNEDGEARRRFTAALGTYGELDHELNELIRLNRLGAATAMEEAASLQRTNEAVQWVTRLAGLVALLLFGWWGTRRVARYERQITTNTRALEERTRELQQRTAELEDRNRDLDAFAGRVAHDLKNALGPIALAPSLLRHSTDSAARIREIADRTERSSARATGIVSSLLAFARAGQSADADESASPAAVLRDVLDEIAPAASELRVTIDIGDIPEVRVRCGPGLLHVVLANLCSNAVKYLDGREERRVRVSARREGAECRIDVEDTGPGISADAQARIFEPFYRVEGTRAPGTGIGLATVRRILDARGGRITVDSAVGRGSRFTAWLPVVPASAARLPAAS